MDNENSTLYGKSLPAIFAEGYIRRFEDMMGRSSGMACFQGPAQELISDKEERERWLLPLAAYFRYGAQRQPLDYAYISLFEQGVRRMFLPNELAVISLTKRVGTQWWEGYPPGHWFEDNASLKFLFSSRIVGPMNKLKPHERPERLVVIGLIAFIRSFSEHSDIAYRLSRSGTNVELHIDACPFCLNRSDLCRVSFGIIEGFLAWVHGSHQSNAVSPVLTIDEGVSTAHHIVLERP
jgi:hypothetical protein